MIQRGDINRGLRREIKREERERERVKIRRETMALIPILIGTLSKIPSETPISYSSKMKMFSREIYYRYK
jgi:hypothetical protein